MSSHICTHYAIRVDLAYPNSTNPLTTNYHHSFCTSPVLYRILEFKTRNAASSPWSTVSVHMCYKRVTTNMFIYLGKTCRPCMFLLFWTCGNHWHHRFVSCFESKSNLLRPNGCNSNCGITNFVYSKGLLER